MTKILRTAAMLALAVLGLSGCHSSLLKKFKAVAEEHQVNLYQLIVAVSARDQKSPSDELMAKTAAALQ